MKLCYFGIYDQEYTRFQVNIKRLQKSNIKVVFCNEKFSLQSTYSQSKLKIIFKKINLFYLRLRYLIGLFIKFLIKGLDCKFILVGHPYDYDIYLAYFLAKMTGKKLLFDPFVSNFETALDRGAINKNSYNYRYLYFRDKIAFSLPDCVIVDTFAHGDYFKREFKLKNKIQRLLVAADEDIFYPKDYKKEDDYFYVLFYGGFIPLHGIEYIIKAAKIVEKKDSFVKFRIIGNGQTYPDIIKLSKELNCKNIEFKEFMPQESLPEEIKKCDIGLGIFGGTLKADLVIPNKVYQLMAMKKPVITRSSNAVTEIFNDLDVVYFCRPADEFSLAEAILDLKNNPLKREKLAQAGHLFYQQNFSLDKTSQMLFNILRDV